MNCFFGCNRRIRHCLEHFPRWRISLCGIIALVAVLGCYGTVAWVPLLVEPRTRHSLSVQCKQTAKTKLLCSGSNENDALGDVDASDDSLEPSGNTGGAGSDSLAFPPSDLVRDLEKSTVRIDDGGSDLTDRFKYKVLLIEMEYM